MSTFYKGRNEEKRIARSDQVRKRKQAVAIHAHNKFPGRAPKRKFAGMIDLLSDRRLRQTGWV